MGRTFCARRASQTILSGTNISQKNSGTIFKIAPAAIVFRQAVHGKPYLATSPIALQFNMTHSQDLALYAVTLNQEIIGIDLEWINPDLAVSPLVSRFFTTQEQQFFSLLSVEQQRSAFYRLWTQKEAWLKATGIGLNGLEQMAKVPLTALTINFTPAPGFIAALGVTVPDILLQSTLSYYVLDGSITL
jgi:hypothetical protein